MTAKESLWYLVKGLLDKKYDIASFCNEFTRIYNLELDYDELNETEHKEFKELSTMAARFSDNEEELKNPKMYVSEIEIRDKAQIIMRLGCENRQKRSGKARQAGESGEKERKTKGEK